MLLKDLDLARLRVVEADEHVPELDLVARRDRLVAVRQAVHAEHLDLDTLADVIFE